MKLGTLDISACKFGTQDPQIYLGTTKIYPTEPTPTAVGKMKCVYSDSTVLDVQCDSSTTINQADVVSGSSLVSVEIGDCIDTIGGRSFSNLYSLSAVTASSATTQISAYAFYGDSSLVSLTVKATTPPSLGSDALRNTSNDLVIYVPQSAVSAYQTEWSSYSSRIQAIPT